MTPEIWTILLAIFGSVPVTSWLTSIFNRRKYNTELSKLKAEIETVKAEVKSKELENVRAGNEILMEQIVTPLKQEMKTLRSDVNKFRKAIEKIPACPHSDNCPVRNELYNIEKSDVEQTHGRTNA